MLIVSGCQREKRFGKTGLIQPEQVAGCYTLTLSTWRPNMNLGGDEIFATPPPVIQMFTARGKQGFESDGFIVRPMRGTPASIHRSSYWEPLGPDSIEIIWTTGFSGLTMNLIKQSDGFRGTAKTFWDFGRAEQTSDVAARKIRCKDETGN
jgi:hypothetical protein